MIPKDSHEVGHIGPIFFLNGKELKITWNEVL